jgi:hypothetical protein
VELFVLNSSVCVDIDRQVMGANKKEKRYLMYQLVKIKWGNGRLRKNMCRYKGRKKVNNVLKGGCLEVEGTEEKFGNRGMSDV